MTLYFDERDGSSGGSDPRTMIDGVVLQPYEPLSGVITPLRALADMNRYGPGDWQGASVNHQGDVTWTVRADGFPGGDVDLGEVPDSLVGGRIAHWYVPSSQGTVPLSLYYDLGRPLDVETAHLWWRRPAATA